jgi:hypothetical protein
MRKFGSRTDIQQYDQISKGERLVTVSQSKQSEVLTLLQNPTTGNSLVLEDGAMVDPITGERFEIRNGIPVTLRKDDVLGNNRKQQIAYDWFSYAYDLMYRLDLWNLQQWLDELAEIMAIKSGDRVLETSVGTGQQVRNLVQHGIDGHFFGNDISYGMLNKCRRKQKSGTSMSDSFRETRRRSRSRVNCSM